MKKYIDNASYQNDLEGSGILKALPAALLFLVLSTACQYNTTAFDDVLIECPDSKKPLQERNGKKLCLKVDCPPGTEDSEDIVCVGSVDMGILDMNVPNDMGDMSSDMSIPSDMADMNIDMGEDFGSDMNDMDIPDMNLPTDMGTDMDTLDMMDMNVTQDMGDMNTPDMNLPTDMGEECSTQMLTQRDQILGVLDDHEAIMSSTASNTINGNSYGSSKFTLEFGSACNNQVSNYEIATVNGVNVAKATNQICEASYRFTNGPIGNRDNTETTTRTFTNGVTFVANFGGSNGGVIPTGQPSLTVELDANGQLKVNGQPSTLCTSYENEIITKINN